MEIAVGEGPGRAVLKFDNSNDYLVSMDIDSHGRVVLVGLVSPSAFGLPGLRAAGIARLTPTGQLDSSLDNDGVMALSGFGFLATPIDALVQRDDKIVLSVESRLGTGSLANELVRVLPGGGLDSGFATGGRLLLAHGQATGLSLAPDNGLLFLSHELVAGTTYAYLNRVRPQGDFDPAFGGAGGLLLSPAIGSGTAQALAVQPDGKILVAFRVGVQSGLLRLDAQGNVDTGFGSAGTVWLGTAADGLRLALQSDGHIVVGGNTQVVVDTSVDPPRTEPQGVLWLMTSTGALVPVASAPIGQAELVSLAVAPDDKIVLAGTRGDDFTVARLLKTGAADTAFAAGGVATLDVAGGVDVAKSVAVLADGGVLVAGWSGERETSNGIGAVVRPDFSMLRLTSSGAPDIGFPGNTATPDLGQLAVTLKAANGGSAVWTATPSGFSYSGDLTIGHRGGEATLSLRHGSALLTGNSLSLSGDFDLLLATGSRAFFSGQLSLDVNTATGAITETAGLLRLAGITLDARLLVLQPGSALLTSQVVLPSFGISGVLAIELPELAWLSSGFQPFSVSVPEADWRLGGAKLTLEDLRLSYLPLVDTLRLGGAISFKPGVAWLGKTAEAEVKTSGDGLVFRNGHFDAALQVAVVNVRFGDLFVLESLSMSLDTAARKAGIAGSAHIDFSRGQMGYRPMSNEFGLGLEVAGHWDGDFEWASLRLDSVAVVMDADPGIPVYGRSVYLTRLGGGLDNISQWLDGNGSPSVSGLVGFQMWRGTVRFEGQASWDFGPHFSGELSGWIGKGGSRLVELEAALDLDLEEDRFEAAGKVTLRLETARSKVPAWIPELALDWLPRQPLVVSSKLVGKLEPLSVSLAASFDSIPGLESTHGGLYLNIVDDENPSNDYIKAWARYDFGIGPFRIEGTVGVQWFFDGEIQFFGAEGVPPVGSWVAEPGMPSLLMSARWTEPAPVTPRTRVVVYSDAAHTRVLSVYEEADYEANGIAVLSDWSSPTGLTVGVLAPLAGVWDLEIKNPSALGTLSYSAFVPQAMATLELAAAQVVPDGLVVDFRSASRQPDAQIRFFLDDDASGLDGQYLGSTADSDGTGRFVWPTIGAAAGTYWVYAVLDAQDQAPVSRYLARPVVLTAQAAAANGFSASDDRILGTPATERLAGGLGNDLFRLRGGADSVLGGPGDDVAILPGRPDGYRLATLADGAQAWVDIDPADGDHGEVRLFDVELSLFEQDPALLSLGALSTTDADPPGLGINELLGRLWASNLAAPAPATGLRVVGLQAGKGTWQYRASDDTEWTTAEPGAGLDLKLGGMWLRLVPAAGATGTAAVEFASWDPAQDTGTAPVITAVAQFTIEPPRLVLGTAAAERLEGSAGPEQLDGAAGNDTLIGAAGNDSLLGGAGDDVLRGGVGSDTLSGQDGLDVADYRDAQGVVADLGAGTALADGAEDLLIDIEALFGSNGPDLLRGRDGVPAQRGDILRGGGGSDRLEGGTGIDSAEWTSPSSHYAIFRSAANTLTVSDRRNFAASGTEADGVDTLVDIERLVFADQVLAFGSRAEEVARVAFVLWSPAIASSSSLFAIGLSYYDGGYAFDLLCTTALGYWPEQGADFARLLLRNTPGTLRSLAEVMDIMATAGGGNAGRAAAVAAMAMDPATTRQLQLSGVLDSGIAADHSVPGFGVLHGLLPG